MDVVGPGDQRREATEVRGRHREPGIDVDALDLRFAQVDERWSMAVMGQGGRRRRTRPARHECAVLVEVCRGCVPVGTPLLILVLEVEVEPVGAERDSVHRLPDASDRSLVGLGRLAGSDCRRIHVACELRVAVVELVRRRAAQRVGMPGCGDARTSRVPAGRYSEGARKPVPHEPRSSNDCIGCQRRLTLGLVVLPKSL